MRHTPRGPSRGPSRGPAPGPGGAPARGGLPALGALPWRGTSRRRRAANLAVGALVWGCVALAVLPLLDLLATVAHGAWRAVAATTGPAAAAAPGAAVLQALGGTALLVGGGAVLAIPAGVLAGTWVAEGRGGALVRLVRFCGGALGGAPSVALGCAAFFVLVRGLGWGASWIAGSLTLAVLMLPLVARATDAAVSAVSTELREASLALGADAAATVRRVVLPAARPRVRAGILLALAVGGAETAALLWTVGPSGAAPPARAPLPQATAPHFALPYLTAAVWLGPPAQAWLAAGVLLCAVLALGLLAHAGLRGRVG